MSGSVRAGLKLRLADPNNRYAGNRMTRVFVLIDETANDTVGVSAIVWFRSPSDSLHGDAGTPTAYVSFREMTSIGKGFRNPPFEKIQVGCQWRLWPNSGSSFWMPTFRP